jgi:hypothetical protein
MQFDRQQPLFSESNSAQTPKIASRFDMMVSFPTSLSPAGGAPLASASYRPPKPPVVVDRGAGASAVLHTKTSIGRQPRCDPENR